MRPPILRLSHEIIVDSFAGGGGASSGIEQALGRSPDIAINHDPEAIAMHQANHPDTQHYLTSVWDVDPVVACGGRPVGLMWASPDCTFHSKARGGKPFRDRNPARRRRGLAWVIVRWAASVRPRVIAMENVEEFADWGPLGEDGKPCPLRKGLTFRRFVKQLQNLGYSVDWQQLRACDYGAPTIRRRLFLIARCDGLPIIWPDATHGHGRTPYRTAAECIDWSIPCPSIFERERPLAENTLRRIARGLQRYVIDSPEPFIVGVGGRAGQSPERPVWKPYQTITSKADAALVVPVLTEIANASSPRCMPADEPLRTICATPKGGHHALVTAFLAQHNGGFYEGPGRNVGDPLSTIVHRGTQQQLVTSTLVNLRGTADNQLKGHPIDAPLPTISSGGIHAAEVRAFLIKYYRNEREGCSLRSPIGTVTTKDRFGLVTIHGQDYAITDIGMRMLTPRELFNAQGFADSYRIDIEHNGKPLTKTAQVRMCGNSVCPPVAAAIVRANVAQRHQEAAA